MGIWTPYSATPVLSRVYYQVGKILPTGILTWLAKNPPHTLSHSKDSAVISEKVPCSNFCQAANSVKSLAIRKIPHSNIYSVADPHSSSNVLIHSEQFLNLPSAWSNGCHDFQIVLVQSKKSCAVCLLHVVCLWTVYTLRSKAGERVGT